VTCLFCRAVIALHLAPTDTDSVGEPLEHVILAWCRVCQKEAPYRLSEVVNFSETA
jgi:hypothetical protein